jgi:phosphotriesterase-related protein
MNSFIQTVQGKIKPADFGPALVHEHLLVDFIGASRINRSRYSQDNAFKVMLPFLQEIKKQGFKSFVECTPMFLGRDPVLFQRLSIESGIQVLTNTGLYAAGERQGEPEPFLPGYAGELEAEALAGDWLGEWYRGIEGTDIRPGFVKIGVNPGELRPNSEKVVRAAAITSRHSGLVVACHTVKGVAALHALDIFDQEEVNPNRFIFVHAQGEEDFALQQQVASVGAWMEYDGIGPESSEKHLRIVLHMLDKGFENQILLSQDAGWYRPGEPDGGNVRGFTFLKDQFVPMMHEAGISEKTVDKLLVSNPARAFAIANR